MKIPFDLCGTWYHGSNVRLTELKVGSTITQWRELAEAFSHKPTQLEYGEDGSILHNGQAYGYLYAVDEPVVMNDDVYQHPRTAMDPKAEFLTKRPLMVRLIAELPV